MCVPEHVMVFIFASPAVVVDYAGLAYTAVLH